MKNYPTDYQTKLGLACDRLRVCLIERGQASEDDLRCGIPIGGARVAKVDDEIAELAQAVTHLARAANGKP